MTRAEFDALMEKASPTVKASGRKAIGESYETRTSRKVSDPKPQRDKSAALALSNEGEKEGTPRITVRFTGCRVRPLDPDNFAGSVKDLLDGCRHSGLIPGDEPWRIRLETEQVHVRKFAEEETVIEIDIPEPDPHSLYMTMNTEKHLLWSEDFDNNGNTVWEAPGPFSEDDGMICYRIKQRLVDNRHEFYEASDEEIMDNPDFARIWTSLAEAQDAMETDCRELLEKHGEPRQDD